MKNLPKNPHAIIELGIEKTDSVTKKKTWTPLGIYDSWETPRLFKSVRVELTTNQLSEARFDFFDSKFKVIDRLSEATGIPQATVRVYLGYGQNLGKPIFKGLLAHAERGESATSFIAFDMGFKMKRVKNAGYINKKDDLEILQLLAGRNELSFEPPDEKLDLEPYRAMMQDEQTDWEHALERARDAGLVLFVREDVLFAKKPAKFTKPTLTLINHRDFVLQRNWDFIYRTPESQDSRPRIVARRARRAGGRRLEGKSDESKRGRESVVLKRDTPSPTKKKLTRRAQAQKDLEREHAFEGQIQIAFPPNGERLDVRNTVKIMEIGKLFSGDYLCDTVTYSFAAGHLGLELELYRDAKMG